MDHLSLAPVWIYAYENRSVKQWIPYWKVFWYKLLNIKYIQKGWVNLQSHPETKNVHLLMWPTKVQFPKHTTAHVSQQRKYNPTGKWSKGLNRHFSKEHIQMTNRCMKRYSTSLVVRAMQIKTTMRYYLTLVRMAIIKKFTNNISEDQTKKGLQMLERVWRILYTIGENINWLSHYGKQYRGSPRN